MPLEEKVLADGHKWLKVDGKWYKVAPPEVAFNMTRGLELDFPKVNLVPGWKFFWNRKKKEEVINNIQPVTTILTIEDIRRIVVEKAVDTHYGDLRKRTGDVPKLVALLRENNVADHEYIEEEYDCEDYCYDGFGWWHRYLWSARMATFIKWIAFRQKGEFMAHSMLSIITATEEVMVEPMNYKTCK